jgi:xanthine dehydrogenase molybdopterin-binding subunit B
VKRAEIPHGRIHSVDVAEAAALPGVVAVLTAKDVPGANRQGIVHKDQPVLCDGKVRHCGDAFALVIAADRETLKKAFSLRWILSGWRRSQTPVPSGERTSAVYESCDKVVHFH